MIEGGLGDESLYGGQNYGGQTYFPTPEAQRSLDLGVLSRTQFAPDGDGLTNVTLIGINGTDQYLGIVLNV